MWLTKQQPQRGAEEGRNIGASEGNTSNVIPIFDTISWGLIILVWFLAKSRPCYQTLVLGVNPHRHFLLAPIKPDKFY